MKLTAKLFALTACAALLICPASNTFAQSKPAKPDAKPKPAADAPKEPDPWQRRIREIQFEAVPLSNVAGYLAEAGQFPEINFLVSPAIKEVPVSISLRSVTLDNIFTALDVASQGAVQANQLTDRMVSFTQHTAPPAEEVKPVCRAFSLSRYLAGKSEKEVGEALTSIEAALNTCWEMLRNADRSNTKAESPQLNLHRGTKLLIVVGQPSQVEVVEQVISQLEGGNAGLVDPATGLPADAFRARYGVSPPAVSPSPAPTPGSK